MPSSYLIVLCQEVRIKSRNWAQLIQYTYCICMQCYKLVLVLFGVFSNGVGTVLFSTEQGKQPMLANLKYFLEKNLWFVFAKRELVEFFSS